MRCCLRNVVKNKFTIISITAGVLLVCALLMLQVYRSDQPDIRFDEISSISFCNSTGGKEFFKLSDNEKNTFISNLKNVVFLGKTDGPPLVSGDTMYGFKIRYFSGECIIILPRSDDVLSLRETDTITFFQCSTDDMDYFYALVHKFWDELYIGKTTNE